MPRTVLTASPESFTSFGDLLKYLRRRAHLTQKDLSIAVGYSEPQISYLETNRRLPDVATVAARFVSELDLDDAPELARRLIDLAEAARHEADPAPGDPPFKGLQYFDESDADLFFGREELTSQLVTRLNLTPETQSNTDLRFLAIVGASGSGKSSIVRAGLLPTLRQHPANVDWRLQVITPTAHPLQVLADYPDTDVLVVDQFEELFTLCADVTERTTFIDQLLDRGRAAVVIALRADFYSECAHYANLREALAQHQEYIGPMNTMELRRAIEEPARRGGWEFEPGLIDLLLRDTSEEPGALPLLSHALLETWTRRRGRTLTVSGYLASGGVQGAIAETAETVFNDELDLAQRAVARNIFLRLTELGEGTQAARRRADMSELISRSGDEPLVESVINRLANARLIITSESTVEIAHEALIREWPLLHQWLIEDRESLLLHRQLAIAALAWDSNGRPTDELYRGARLARALEWATAHSAEMNVIERNFLGASRELAEHEQIEREAQLQRELDAAQMLAAAESRAAKQLRRRAIFLTGAFVLAIILAGAAFLFSRQATTNAQTAQREQQVAIERELAASAVNNLSVDPERSMLLALQAVNTSVQNNQPVLIEAQDALHRSIQSSHVLATLKGHIGGVWSVAVNRSGTQLASISQDGTAKVWDVGTGQVVATLPTKMIENLDGTGVAFSAYGKQLLTVSDDNSARVWDLATSQTLFILKGHADLITSVAVSPDGKLFATASDDTTVKLWDATTGQEVKTLIGHEGNGLVVTFSADGQRIYAGSDGDGYAIAWNVATGQELFRFSGQGNVTGVDAIAASPDGTRVATGEFDTTIKVWDSGAGKLLLTLFGHSSQVVGVAFSADGKYIASASEDGTVKLWDAITGKDLLTLSGHTSGVLGVTFSPDGNRLYTSSRDGTVKVWDISPTAGSDWLNLAGHTGRIGFVTYSPDAARLATFGLDGTAKVWDAASGKMMLSLAHGDTNCVGNVSYSSDGSRLVVAGNTEPKVFDAVTGAVLLTLTPFEDSVCNILFSPDGTRLAAGSDSGLVRIYDSSNGKMLIEFSTSPAGIQQLAFSPDGKRIASASNDGASVWDVATGKQVLTFNGHGVGVRLSGIAYSPDGKLIASAGNDSAIRVWDSETSAEVFTLTGHTGPAFGVAFSPDGQSLASSSVDRTIKVWKLPQPGQPIPIPLTLYGHTGAVYRIAFSPDGRHLASVGRNPIVRIYDLNIDDLLGIAKARLTRTLTLDECVKYLHIDQCPVAP